MEESKKYIFVVIVSIIQIFLIIALFYPPVFQNATVFDSTNYYAVISALIGSNMTLLVISLQFSIDRSKKHEEEIVKARGFFEINYLLEPNTVIEPYVSMQNVKKKMSWLECKPIVMLRLHSQDVILNCRVNIDVVTREKEKVSFENLFGVVVPNQLLGVPFVADGNIITMAITYTTKMNEVILHKLEFNNGITKSCISNGEKIISNYENRKPKTLIESDSILFKYVHR